MRRTKAKITKVYSVDSDYPIDSYISGYYTVNIPRFKHKKKPISMIKALQVRDRIGRKKIFYDYEKWKEIRGNHFPENTVLLSEAGGGDIGKTSVTNLETGEKKWI